MISKGTKVVDYVEVWIDNKTGKFSELVYIVDGWGRFFRRNKSWVPVFEETVGQYDDTRVIAVEKKDARDLKLVEKYDSGKKIDIKKLAEYETEKYYA
jgi:hypothetical protein